MNSFLKRSFMKMAPVAVYSCLSLQSKNKSIQLCGGCPVSPCTTSGEARRHVLNTRGRGQDIGTFKSNSTLKSCGLTLYQHPLVALSSCPSLSHSRPSPPLSHIYNYLVNWWLGCCVRHAKAWIHACCSWGHPSAYGAPRSSRPPWSIKVVSNMLYSSPLCLLLILKSTS